MLSGPFLRTEMTGAVPSSVDELAGTVPHAGNQYLLDAPGPSPRAGRTGGGIALAYRRGRDGGAKMETHSLDEPACALRGADGGSTQPLLLDSPSPTLRAQSAKDASGHQGGHCPPMLATAGRRRLTVEECAKLMSWPDGYPLQGTKTSRYRQVGNGCTPPVVEALGLAVIAAMGMEP
jgi:site-specific DNA-cytosine methylase